MGNVLSILLALVVLGVIITVHEFGHYFVGKSLGIGVVEFSIGFGPKLVSWKRKETKYSIRLLPLGGYCAFLGEDAEAKDPNAMNNQPVWKRFLTVLAGPALNIILAFIVAVVLIAGGYIYNPFKYQTYPVLVQVVSDSPAEKAGLMVGDIVTHANGEEISFDDVGTEKVRDIIMQSSDKSVALTVARGQADAPDQIPELIDIEITPLIDATENRPMIGVSFGAYYDTYDCNVFTAIPEAAVMLKEVVVMTVGFLKDMVIGLIGGRGVDDGALTGVVGIVSEMSTDVRQGLVLDFSDGMMRILNWILIISLNLGIMNLLPLPALDGGRLVFLAIEGIRRKPLNREREGVVHLIGLALLLALAVFITYKDIARIIGG